LRTILGSFGILHCFLVDVRKNRLPMDRDPRPDGYATVREFGDADTSVLEKISDMNFVADAFLDVRDD